MKRQALNSLFQPRPSLSATEIRRGLKFVVADGICSQAMGAYHGGPFLVSFALALGASNLDIGVLAAIPMISQFAQIPAVYLVERLKNRKLITVLFAASSRMIWLIIIAIPLLFIGRQGTTLLMLALLASAICGAISGASWNSMLRDLIPEQILGRLFSRRMMFGTGLALILSLLGGYFLDRYSQDKLCVLSLLFAIGLLFGLVGIFFLAKTPERAMASKKEEQSLWDLFLKPFSDSNFRNLIFFAAVWNFAINLAAPFFTVYMLKRLNLDMFFITILLTISQVANIIFFRVWGPLCDRLSNKSILSVSGALYLLVILTWTFTTMPERHFLTIPLLILIHILGGVALAGISLATANIALKLSPKGDATAYLVNYGISSNFVAAVAPLLGGVLADFFAVRQLAFTFAWVEPSHKFVLEAISIEEFDFLFLFAFLLGLYALYRLGKVREEGEVKEAIVVRELISEFVRDEKSLSTIGGIRRLTFFPLLLAYRTLRSYSWLWEQPSESQKSEVN